MSGVSNERKLSILEAIFKGTAYSEAGPYYLALVTVAVTGADTGETIKDATYTGYARVKLEHTDFNTASGGATTNKNPATFGECTAGESTVIGWALCTALTKGLVIASGTIPTTVVSKGIVPKFAAGALSFSFIDT
jgi:hypothetical protein